MRKMPVRPPALRLHDRAVILSPAGKIDATIVENAAAVLSGWGLTPEISRHALSACGRFSGIVAERLADLQRAFDDPEVRLILCARGGYGTVHLLDKLDFTGIREHPKWVVGYSDITVLHAALQMHGIASVHGPMAKHLADEVYASLQNPQADKLFSMTGEKEDAAAGYLKKILYGASLSYRFPVTGTSSLNRCGMAVGQLFGGNLSLFCSILGSKYAQIPQGGVLCVEDIGEEPYRVDRMIYQLKIAGVFEKIGGLVVGQFTDYQEDDGMYAPLYASIREAVGEYAFPLCFSFPVGHVKQNYPLMMGRKARLAVGEDHILFEQ